MRFGFDLLGRRWHEPTNLRHIPADHWYRNCPCSGFGVAGMNAQHLTVQQIKESLVRKPWTKPPAFEVIGTKPVFINADNGSPATNNLEGK